MRITAPCDHSDFTCEPCAQAREEELAEAVAEALSHFRALWSDEGRYPWLRLSGRALHRRGCHIIEAAIEAFHREDDPYRLPRFVTEEEATSPRRPVWTPCKFCKPDIEPPERPLLPKRPKVRRDQLAEWLSRREQPTDDDGWRVMADEIMAGAWRRVDLTERDGYATVSDC